VSLVEGRPGHWRLRPLVLDYARQRADQDLQEPGRSNALQRALAYQLAQVRGQRRKIAEAAKVHPATAARLQAELDLELARGAVLVDAAVGRGLDLLELAGENLADVLHEVIRVWPDPDWRRKAVGAIRMVAAREPEAATVDRPEAVARQQRARRWLAEHPEEPPPRPVRHAAGAYPPAPPVPGPEEIRRFREQAELLGALERSGGQRPVPEQVDHRPLDQGTMRVFGTGFWAYETIRIRVDSDYEWTTQADASGAYDTSRPYGPGPGLPVRAHMTGLTSGIQAETGSS
jgi:hypothetical protein